jgi:hypothetical protein
MSKSHVEIVEVGDDPFDRGEVTVFYRDFNVNGGKEVFYLWRSQWSVSYPDVPVPPYGFNIRPPLPPRRPPCVPWVLTPIGTRSRTGEPDPRLKPLEFEG